MTSWHLNIWKYKIWLSQKRKELSKWNKKIFFLVSQVLSFRDTIQTSKNVVDTTLKDSGGTWNEKYSSVCIFDYERIIAFWKCLKNCFQLSKQNEFLSLFSVLYLFKYYAAIIIVWGNWGKSRRKRKFSINRKYLRNVVYSL